MRTGTAGACQRFLPCLKLSQLFLRFLATEQGAKLVLSAEGSGAAGASRSLSTVLQEGS